MLALRLVAASLGLSNSAATTAAASPARPFTSDELTALSLALGALRSDLERRHLGLPTG